MGMVLAFAALFTLAVSAALAVTGLLLYLASKKKNGANLAVYLLVTVLLPVIYLGFVYLYAVYATPAPSNGAPTGDEYTHWMVVAALLGFSPGIGSFFGGVLLFIRSHTKKDPE